VAFLYSAGGSIMGSGNSLSAAVYDGHGGDQISRELERVMLQVRAGYRQSDRFSQGGDSTGGNRTRY